MPFISDFINQDVRRIMLEELGQEFSYMGKAQLERAYLLNQLGEEYNALGTNDLWRRFLLNSVASANTDYGTITLLREYLLETAGQEYNDLSTAELMRRFFTGDPLRELINAGATFLVDPRFADGQPWVKLEPRTLPNGVSNTDFTKNVSDDYVLQASDITLAVALSNTVAVRVNKQSNDINFGNLVIRVGSLYPYEIASVSDTYNSVESIGKWFPNQSNTQYFVLFPLGTTLAQAQALLAGTVIRYQLATPIDTLNTPFTNPLVDRVGKVGKNLFDPMATTDGYIVNQNTGNLDTSSSYCTSDFITVKANEQYSRSLITSTRRVAFYDADKVFISGGLFDTFTTPVNCVFIRTSCLISEKFTFMLNEGDTLLPYEPYGKTNVRLEGFAGTSASGYELKLLPNGNEVVGLTFDGANDFGQLLASDKLNPTGTQDFAQLVVFERDEFGGLVNQYFGISRNLNDLATRQYGLNKSETSIYYAINGVSVQIPNITDELQWILYGRIDGKRFLIRNDAELHESEFTDNIVSRPNIQLGCRSASIDGLTKMDFAKGDQHPCAFFYNGDDGLDKDKIIKACKRYIKDYF